MTTNPNEIPMARATGKGFITEKLDWHDEVLTRLEFPTARMEVTRGVGSGMTRCRADPPDRIWGIGDRGPNLKVDVALRRYGVESMRPHLDLDGAKMMPCLQRGPALAELRLDGDRVTLLRTVELRGTDGEPVSGLPVSMNADAEQEPVFSTDGRALGTDPSGVDSEGIAALADGSFWIGDEYGPSLLKVDRNGTVIVRWVPAGTAPIFEGSSYPVAAVLPPVASARRLNRGFEALALSPDERWLYVIFQSPLAHPDRAAHKRSRHVRIWQLDAASGECVAQFVYPLDPPAAFRRDTQHGDVNDSDIKVSEVVMLGVNRLLVLERVSQSTKFYRVDLLPRFATPNPLIDADTRPTIEQMDSDRLKQAGITPLLKTLVFDTDEAPEICADLEGAVVLSPRALLLVNDNDFGVEGVATEFWRVTFDEDVF